MPESLEEKTEQQGRNGTRAGQVEQINAYLRAGDYARAADLSRGAVVNFPNDAELAGLKKSAQEGVQRKAEADRLITESQELFAQQKSAEAIELLRKAYELDKRNSLARAILANALVEHAQSLVEMDWLKSETLTNQALALNPAHPTAKTVLNLIVERKQNSSVDDWVAQAKKLQSSGDLFGALAWVAEGLAVHPNDPKMLQIQDAIQKDQGARKRQARRGDLDDLRRMQREIEKATDVATKQALAARIQGIAAKHWTDGEILSIANALLLRLGLVSKESSGASPRNKGATLILHVPRPGASKLSDGDNDEVPASEASSITVAAGNVSSPAEVSPIPVKEVSSDPVAASKPLSEPVIADQVLSCEVLSSDILTDRIQTDPALAEPILTNQVSSQSAPAGSVQMSEAPAKPIVPATRVAAAKVSVKKSPSGTVEAVKKPTVAPAPRVAPPKPVSVPAQESASSTKVPKPASSKSKPRAESNSNSTMLIVVAAAAVILVAATFFFTRRHYASSAVNAPETSGAVSVPAASAPAASAPVSAPNPSGPAISESAQATPEASLPATNLSSDADSGKAVVDDQPPAAAGRDVGSLVVVAGQDGAKVVLNGRPQRRLTQAGQIRVANLEVKDYVVQVSKTGFQDPPQQTIRIRKGEETRLVFNLQPQPPHLASLSIQGGTPGTTVLVDQAAVGTVQADGTLSVSTVNPGDHTVELRKDRFKPRLLKKHFVAGAAVSLAAAEATLEGAPGEVKINFVPADAKIAVVKGDLLKIVSSGVPLSLAPGTYTLTARTAERFTRSSTFEVLAGESKTLDLSLTPNGMSKWEDAGAWKHEGDTYTRKGGDFVLYGVAPASGTFVFSAMPSKGRLLQWVINYADAKNYILLQMDDNSFYRSVIRNGEKTDQIIVPHKVDKKSFRMLQIRVSAGEVVHQIKNGESWVVLDRWAELGVNLGQGKFGFYIPGGDQVTISSFAHYADLNLR